MGQESQKVFLAVALLSAGSVGSWEEAKRIQAVGGGGSMGTREGS